MAPQHEVLFVCDRHMPPEHDWMMIEMPDAVVCVVRDSQVSPQVLEEAWAGYRDLLAAS